MHVRKNARYAERVPDAVYVLEAKPLERKPGPCRMSARIGHSRPVMAVVGCVRLHEPEVKKRKVVDQLEKRTLCPLPKLRKPADETALLQHLQIAAQRTAVFNSRL